jgi:lysophospholipase L1-like esterase
MPRRMTTVASYASLLIASTTACSSSTAPPADGTGNAPAIGLGTGATTANGGSGALPAGSGNSNNTGNATGAGNATSGGGVPNVGAGGSPLPMNGTGSAMSQGGSGETVGAGGATGGGGVAGSGETTSGGGIANGGGGGAGAGNSGGAAGVPVPTKPPCLSAGADAAIIGDSYVTGAASPALQPALGMLDATVNTFRNYAIPGTSLATGGVTGLIPAQLVGALTATTKALIMDGGGNDILICDALQFPGCGTVCSSAGSSKNMLCQSIVQKALDAATAMLKSASDSGVHDTIYFFYPHIPDRGTGGGGFDEILDYAEPIAKKLCDSAPMVTGGKMSCYFVSLVQPFKAAGGDKNPLNFAGDGIHPSQAGQNIIANEIYKVMKAQCIGMTQADAMKNGCTCM